MILLNTNTEKSKNLLNEVYIGKTPELLAIEKQLDVFRKKYMWDSSIKGQIKKGNVNTDPDLLKVNRMLEDYFGFGCLSITVWHSMQPNAFTLSLSHRYDAVESVTNNFSITKQGYKFNKRIQYSCIIVVYDSIMFSKNFSTPEVMAVILHEIGHNFNLIMEGRHGLFTRLYTTLIALINALNFNILALALQNNSIINAVNKAEQDIQTNHKIIASIGNYFIYGLQVLKSFKNLPISLLKIFTLGLSHVLLFPLALIGKAITNPAKTIADMIVQPITYAHEREADNFATIHGYGPETVSVQSKIGTDSLDKAIKEVPLIGHIYSTNLFIIDLILDPHPQNGNRMQDQLDLLKHEIKKEDLDPKMKKEMLADIKACEVQVNKLYDISKGIKDPDLIRHAYWRVCYKLFNNRTIKDMFMSLILGNPDHRFDEYDKVYNIYKE